MEQQTAYALGDRIVIRYLDDNKIATFMISGDRSDP